MFMIQVDSCDLEMAMTMILTAEMMIAFMKTRMLRWSCWSRLNDGSCGDKAEDEKVGGRDGDNDGGDGNGDDDNDGVVMVMTMMVMVMMTGVRMQHTDKLLPLF